MSLWFWLLLAAFLSIAVLAFVAWRLARGRVRDLAARVGRLSWRNKARLARALVTDPRIPIWARAIIPLLLLYLALPIDIIPDFIPVLGHLDDLAVVLIAGGLLLRTVPPPLLEEHLSRLEADQTASMPTDN